jgi:hypothetical protein
MDRVTQIRNRIVDITIAVSGVDRTEFFLLRNKKRYAKIRNVCIALLYNKGVHHDDIASTFKMSFQNVFYQLTQIKKWSEAPERHDFELTLYKELEEEFLNKESELTLY